MQGDCPNDVLWLRMALSKMGERVPLSCTLLRWFSPPVLNVLFSDRYHRMLDLEICLHPIPMDGRSLSTITSEQLLASITPMDTPQHDMAYFLKLNNLDPQP